MKYISIRRLLLTLPLIAFLIAVCGCSSISIRTAIEIDAPREQVFAILADLDSYPEWNPYHRSVTGLFREGAKLELDITRPDGKQINIPPHMLRIKDGYEITWGGGMKGIFYGEHSFLLSTTASGSTLVEHNEDFTGAAIGIADLPADVIADGYHQMNIALKKRAEAERK